MRNTLVLFLLFSALWNWQCQSKKGSDYVYVHDDKDLPMPADAKMQLVPGSESGIQFENDIQEDFFTSVITFAYLYNGGGVGILDVNKDGLQDVYFTATTGVCRLYLNEGNFKFRDITESAGVGAEKGIKTGVSIADVNADGWQDIYVSRTGPQANDDRKNLLFINNQNNTFTESAQAYGLADISAGTNALFFDYDNDNDLDVYVLVHPDNFKTVMSVHAKDMGGGVIRRVNEPKAPYESDRLYRNNGDNTFTDVSQQAGIWNRGFGLSINATDFNDDGYLDLYVGNDYVEPDMLYINTGNGSFLEQNFRMFRHISENTMGSDVTDLNNDGLVDVMALDMLSEDYILQKERLTTRTYERYSTLSKYGYGHQQERNVLSINNGNGTFSEIGCLAGTFQTDWSWAILGQDFDNDGWKDIFVTNGYRRDITNADYMMFTSDSINKIPGGLGPKNFKDIYEFLDLIPEHPLQNYMFRNRGDLRYDNVSTPWGLVQKSFSNGAAYADLDNDGDLDLVVNNIAREAFVYRNTAADRKEQNWLQIKLEGDGKNTLAIGAKVRAKAGGQVLYQEMFTTRGFLSAVEPLVHFGLGKMAQVDELEVEFPGRRVIRLTQVPANQRITLKAADAKPGRLSPLPKGKPFLREITGLKGLDYQHQEDNFPDFEQERMLPWRVSTPGPSIASADVNGDGLQDFYVGGAYGSAGKLFVQKAGGVFVPASQSTWDADKQAEDTGMCFFDADGDGDVDLFVASGGTSMPVGNEAYRPRLYINDGKGNFQRKADAVPAITDSGSAVCAMDYDGDGDQDLILGGWSVPGSYPLIPGSHILQNNGGVFADVTAQACPEFAKIGMVRAMAPADVDGDGKAELVVCGEWMPLCVFKTGNGKLENITDRLGLGNTHGFWRSLCIADIDGDGDQDIVGGNLGMNTRYVATESEPLEMYARDFDGNGSIDPIMTRYFAGKPYPLATRDQLIRQIPKLKKKYVRYTPFARATIDKVFDKNELESALHLRAELLHSVIFINEGGKFRRMDLPNEAQVAPVYGITAADLNGDGNLDLIGAGNDYGQQVETGRVDAGNGFILLGDGKGQFKSVYPLQSGFWADQEARSVCLLDDKGKKLILVGNSGGKLQAFEVFGSAPGLEVLSK